MSPHSTHTTPFQIQASPDLSSPFTTALHLHNCRVPSVVARLYCTSPLYEIVNKLPLKTSLHLEEQRAADPLLSHSKQRSGGTLLPSRAKKGMDMGPPNPNVCRRPRSAKGKGGRKPRMVGTSKAVGRRESQVCRSSENEFHFTWKWELWISNDHVSGQQVTYE